MSSSLSRTELLKVAIDVAEGDVFFFANLLGGFLVLQDGTDQFISLNCIHGVASQNLTVDTYLRSSGNYNSKTVSIATLIFSHRDAQKCLRGWRTVHWCSDLLVQ